MKTDNLFKTTLCRNVVCIEILETLTLQKHESLITIDSLLLKVEDSILKNTVSRKILFGNRRGLGPTS